MSSSRPRKALVVGAGPVGSLTAICLHRRGWDVEIWESREDPRGQDTQMANLRSINLNISSRGLEALRSVDPSLAEMLQAESIPMKGRMIHHLSPTVSPESQLYDPRGGQVGHSLSRPILNQRLVEALPDGVKTRFRTKLSRIDFRKRLAWGRGAEGGKAYKLGDEAGGSRGDSSDGKKEQAGEDQEGTSFDLVVGADGSWSKVRSEMMHVERVDFSQSFIQHAYIELHMPPDPSKPGGYAMDANHLHIWPRHSFMLIGLPNKDGSFTLTLFLPFSSLAQIDSRTAAEAFFTENFPSAVEIVGLKPLVDDFENNPRGNLVTTHVLPTCWSSHVILLGDASHSMVPFYGQGLNCGLEDVRIFNSYLEQYKVPPTTVLPLGQSEPVLQQALEAYSAERDADLRAITELAMRNYVEMRDKVLSPLFILRRRLDTLLSTLFRPPIPVSPTSPSSPSSASASAGAGAYSLSLTNPFPGQPVKGWNSLYEMVTFRPDIGYAAALERERWQAEVVKRLALGLGAVGAGTVGLGLWWGVAWYNRRR